MITGSRPLPWSRRTLLLRILFPPTRTCFFVSLICYIFFLYWVFGSDVGKTCKVNTTHFPPKLSWAETGDHVTIDRSCRNIRSKRISSEIPIIVYGICLKRLLISFDCFKILNSDKQFFILHDQGILKIISSRRRFKVAWNTRLIAGTIN